MARREKTITIQREGRDKGATFTIKEMPAYQAEEWFTKAMMVLFRSGADMPPDIFSQGAMGFASLTLGTAIAGVGKTPFTELKPLLDEMLQCITSMTPVGAVAPTTNLQMIKTQIEEPITWSLLREEILSLHLGFSIRERLSTFRTAAAGMLESLGPNTKTSTQE